VKNPFKGTGAAIENMLAPKVIVYSAVCDWNIRLSAYYEPVPNQTYSTQVAFNIFDYYSNYSIFIFVNYIF
jgi:hypothetical protein